MRRIFVMILMAGLWYGGIAWSQMTPQAGLPLYAWPECLSGLATRGQSGEAVVHECYTLPGPFASEGCGCGKILRVPQQEPTYTGWNLAAPSCVGGIKLSASGQVTIGGKTEKELLARCPGLYTP